MTMIRRFVRDARGASSIEYALIAVFVSVLVVGGATAIGTKLSARFAAVSGNLH